MELPAIGTPAQGNRLPASSHIRQPPPLLEPLPARHHRRSRSVPRRFLFQEVLKSARQITHPVQHLSFLQFTDALHDVPALLGSEPGKFLHKLGFVHGARWRYSQCSGKQGTRNSPLERCSQKTCACAGPTLLARRRPCSREDLLRCVQS